MKPLGSLLDLIGCNQHNCDDTAALPLLTFDSGLPSLNESLATYFHVHDNSVLLTDAKRGRQKESPRKATVLQQPPRCDHAVDALGNGGGGSSGFPLGDIIEIRKATPYAPVLQYLWNLVVPAFVDTCRRTAPLPVPASRVYVLSAQTHNIPIRDLLCRCRGRETISGQECTDDVGVFVYPLDGVCDLGCALMSVETSLAACAAHCHALVIIDNTSELIGSSDDLQYPRSGAGVSYSSGAAFVKMDVVRAVRRLVSSHKGLQRSVSVVVATTAAPSPRPGATPAFCERSEDNPSRPERLQFALENPRGGEALKSLCTSAVVVLGELEPMVKSPDDVASAVREYVLPLCWSDGGEPHFLRAQWDA